MGAAISGDSACSACGDAAARGGAPPAASAGPIRPARKLANKDPKMAAPKELPIVRKNVTPDVATPRSVKLAVFCTTSTSTCMHSPIPAPSTNRNTDCCQVGVAASILDSSTNPTAMVAVPATGKILYLPVRPTMFPLPIDVMSIPATIGKVRRPEVVAETPSTNCMNVGRNVSAPSIAKPTMKPRMQQTVKTGLANSRMGRIGSVARVSTQTKKASATAEATNNPTIIGEPQAYSPPPQLVARVSPEAPMPTSRMPA